MAFDNGSMKEWLEELRSRSNLVTVVSRTVRLERKSNRYWGCCPFHHEKTPSFSVDEERGFYHCFGCGESGDVFKFVQKTESVDFMGAVRLLADQAGMQVPSFRDRPVDERAKQRRDKMLEINRLVARRYHENLRTPAGADAQAYLDSRGVSPEMVRKFGLGYSNGYDDVPTFLQRQGYDLELCVEGGLLGRGRNGGYYDVFANRLIFPIIDSVGNVIAFGGRILRKADDAAKYRNTGATFLFDKSKTIYAINLIKKLRLRRTVDSLILCEGYVDVISLHQAGFDTAVASMGTSLTQEQCRILSRFCTTVYISYDGDSAGQKATMRGLEMLREHGLEVRVVTLPDGLDPDDLVKQRGPQAYRNCLDAALPYFEFKLGRIAADYNLSAYDGRTKFATAAIDEIRKLENKIEQERYVNKVAEMTGFSRDSLTRQLGAPVDDGIKVVPTDGRVYSAEEKAAMTLLWALVNRFGGQREYPDLEPYLSDEAHKTLYRAFRDDPELTLARAYDALDEETAKTLGSVADLLDDVPGLERAAYVDGCARLLTRVSLEQRLAALSAEYDSAMTPENKQKILREILALQTQLKQTK